jgi:transposase
MKQKPAGRTSSSEQIIRDIKRKTRKQYSAEEKIRIVLDGLRGEDSIAGSKTSVHSLGFLLRERPTKYFLVSIASRVIAIPDYFHGHEGKGNVQHKDSQRDQRFTRIPVHRAIGQNLAGSNLIRDHVVPQQQQRHRDAINNQTQWRQQGNSCLGQVDIGWRWPV